MAEQNVPSSFIPQDAGVAAPVRRGDTGGLNDLLLLCMIVLFVASAALAAGVFLYEQYLTAETNSKLAQLETARKAFEPTLIRELTRLDDRMHAAESILSKHTAPTAFFSALQQTTLVNVAFRSLDFEAVDPQHMTIKTTGIARAVNSIALQADLFSKNGVISGPIFSSIARQSDGVHFNMTAIVNPVALNYASLISGTEGGAQGGAAPQGNAKPGAPSPFGSLENASSSTQH